MTDSLTRAINTTLMPGFDGPELPDWVREFLAAGLGSVCLFASNIDDAAQLAELTAAIHAANPEALIAVDEEGGDVSRLDHRNGSPLPAAAWLGRRGSVAVTQAVGSSIGAALRRADIDLNLAPVADVNTNPRNPVIGIRSFGSDPAAVAEHVAAYTTGLQAHGVAACAKHFPGHGDTSSDSHRELPTIDVSLELLRERELVPFRAAVDAGTLAVMTSHIMVPQLDASLPATLSAPILTLLRDELGFDGLIVSDAIDMAGASAGRGIPEAAVLALAAGVDLLCIGAGNTADQMAEIAAHIAQAVHDGRLSEARVRDAAARVRQLSARLHAVRDWHPEPTGVETITIEPTFFWCRRRFDPPTKPLLLRLESPANIAAGETVWGIGPELADVVGERLPGAVFATASDLAGVATAVTAHPDRTVVVQGRDLARVPFLTEATRWVLEHAADVLVIEEGWHDPDDPLADIATYGSGRGTMLSVLKLLAEGHR